MWKIRLSNLKDVSLVMLKHLLGTTHTVTATYYREESWICNQNKTVSEPDCHLCQFQQPLSVMLSCHFDSDYTSVRCIADTTPQLFTNNTASCTFTVRVEHFMKNTPSNNTFTKLIMPDMHSRKKSSSVTTAWCDQLYIIMLAICRQYLKPVWRISQLIMLTIDNFSPSYQAIFKEIINNLSV